MGYSYDVNLIIGLEEILEMDMGEAREKLGNMSLEEEFLTYKMVIQSTRYNNREQVIKRLANMIEPMLMISYINYEQKYKDMACQYIEDYEPLPDSSYFGLDMKLYNLGLAKDMYDANNEVYSMYESKESYKLDKKLQNKNKRCFECKSTKNFFKMEDFSHISSEGEKIWNVNFVEFETYCYNKEKVLRNKNTKDFTDIDNKLKPNVTKEEYLKLLIIGENIVNSLNTAAILQMVMHVYSDAVNLRNNFRYDPREKDSYTFKKLKEMEQNIIRQKKNNL